MQQGAGYPNQPLDLLFRGEWIFAKPQITPADYVAQPNEWSCAAAVIVTAARTLLRSDLDLSYAIALTGANADTGATNESVAALLTSLFHETKYQLRVGVLACSPDHNQTCSSVPEKHLHALRDMLREGCLVIVNFREPVDAAGHYAIVRGMSADAILLSDPYYGYTSVLPRGKFDWRSGFSEPVLHGWFAAIKLKQ